MRASGRVEFVAGQPEAIVESDGKLAALTVLGSDGESRELPLDVLFVLLGWSPKLGPIADWGLALEKKQVVVNTASFETSTPGIFAVGDINTYPGKQKLIVCGFHEATLAAFASASWSTRSVRSRCNTRRRARSCTSCSAWRPVCHRLRSALRLRPGRIR